MLRQVLDPSPLPLRKVAEELVEPCVCRCEPTLSRPFSLPLILLEMTYMETRRLRPTPSSQARPARGAVKTTTRERRPASSILQPVGGDRGDQAGSSCMAGARAVGKAQQLFTRASGKAATSTPLLQPTFAGKRSDCPLLSGSLNPSKALTPRRFHSLRKSAGKFLVQFPQHPLRSAHVQFSVRRCVQVVYPCRRRELTTPWGQILSPEAHHTCRPMARFPSCSATYGRA